MAPAEPYHSSTAGGHARFVGPSSSQSATDPARHQLWWSELTDEECPITLEPLSTLPYPPFELYPLGAGAAAGAYRFDGLALASFAISRGVFQNPLTREPLTREDCVRLDDYLQDHCYKGSGGGEATAPGNLSNPDAGSNGCIVEVGGRGGRICVTEAFMLRESVRVRSDPPSASAVPSSNGDAVAAAVEARRRRAEALRSEAAAALRGLFVFGNDRGRERQRASEEGRYSDALLGRRVARGGGEAGTAQPMPSVGFNLYGRPRNNVRNRGGVEGHQGDEDDDVAVLEVDGLRIVDDDLEIAAGSDDAAWRELGELFPRLGSSEGGGGDKNDVTTPPPPPPNGGDASDGDLLRRARHAADCTRVEEERLRLLREQCRERMVEDAIRRREERTRQREEEKARRREERRKLREESEEIDRAREEIERWREEQWEEMRRSAERAAVRRREEERRRQSQPAECKEESTASGAQEKNGASDPNGAQETEDAPDKPGAEAEAAAAKAKAKKAEKRRRAKERQKAKKAEERAEAERERKRKEKLRKPQVQRVWGEDPGLRL